MHNKRTLQDIIEESMTDDPSLIENPFAAYFILEKTRSSVPFTAVNIAVQEKTGFKISREHRLRTDAFFGLHHLLRDDILSAQYAYFVPEGLYLAARDLAFQGTHLNLTLAYEFTHKPKNFPAFVRLPAERIKKEWRPHFFDITLDDIEDTLDFMKLKFKEDKDQFFAQYGPVSGVAKLAEDLQRQREMNTSLKKLYTLVSNGPMLGRMLDVQDQRFTTSWEPHVNFLSLQELDHVKKIARRAYEADPEEFYAVYGSRLGTYILSKELQQEGISISPDRLSSFFSHPSIAQRTLNLEDPHFTKKWNIKQVSGSLESLDTLIDHLETTYQRNPQQFFAEYGCDVGVYYIARDMVEKERIDDIDLDSVSRTVMDGSTLSKAIGVSDERFRTLWHPIKMGLLYSQAVALIDFLRTEYTTDPETFFDTYGSSLGGYYLMKKLRRDPRFHGKPNPTQLNCIILKGERLSRLMGQQDSRFSNSWNPRSLILNDQQIEVVADFLLNKYRSDSATFFRRYGGESGLLALAKDIEKERERTFSPFRLGTLAKHGRDVALLLDVDDERFSHEWNPRSIQTKAGIAERVGNFLREAHERDPLLFFIRYGGAAGQYVLGRDLEKAGIRVANNQLGSLIQKPSVVASLSGISEMELEERWHPNRAYLSLRQLDRIKDFLQERYRADPDSFFEEFGTPGGVRRLALALEKDKSIKPNYHHLCETMRNGQIISAIAGIADERFETGWNVEEIHIAAKQAEPAILHLREIYFSNPEHFFARYGTRAGVYHLADDLRKKGSLVSEDLSNLSDLLTGPHVEDVLDLKDQRFATAWSTKKLPFSLQTFEILFEHLKSQYMLDEKAFFKIYGGKLGTVILTKEADLCAGAQLYLSTVSSLISDGKLVSALLPSEDERFISHWEKRKYNFGLTAKGKYTDLENLVVEGIQRMVTSCSLPSLQQRSKKDETYLQLRYGLRTADPSTGLYLVHLYAEEAEQPVKKNIGEEVAKDREALTLLKEIKTTEDARSFGEEDFMDLAGKLLYSFEPAIRREAQFQLVAIHTPVVERIIGNHEQRDHAWDAFVDYCGRFDLYNVARKQRHQPPLSKRIYSRVKSELRHPINQPTSLDNFSPLGEEESLHEVIG